MNSLGDTYDMNTTNSSKNRKRKTSEETASAIQSLAKALRLEAEAGASTSDELHITDSALQLFARKCAPNHVIGNEITAGIDQDHEQLPPLHDPSAIQAFFRRNKHRSLREFLSALNSAALDPTISNDHPMKQIVEQSDKEMSVKEALAKVFRNYKVRLPKKKLQYDQDPAVDSSVLYSLFANDAVDENQKEAAMTFPLPALTNNHALKSFRNSLLDAEKEKEHETTPLQFDMDALIKNEPVDSSATADATINLSGADEPGEKPCLYKLPPFWSLPVVVSKGYRGGYYIRGVKYVQMTTLIHNGTLMISLNIPIRFEYHEQTLIFSLRELLLANGIAINDPRNCVELCKVFTTSVLLLHHSIAEHLLCHCGPNLLNPNATMKLDCGTIPISAELPPLACHKPEYFELALNGVYGLNKLFHPYRDFSIHCSQPTISTSTLLNPQVDNDEVKKSSRTIMNSCVVSPRVSVRLTARQKGLVVTHFDTGASIKELSVKFGVSTEAIESIILNRAEVIRDQTAALMAETDADEDRDRSFSGTRKKTRVRRTSFVGLNILMWRFFKDCRDNGIVLNGKLLKEHAMMIARQLGLENFKGSEGWLDAFKRRHRIDLKLMSGVPVNYEETDEDKMEDIHDEGNYRRIMKDDSVDDRELSISQAHSSGGGITAALLECVEKATASNSSAPVAVASISSTRPLDLTNLFGTCDGQISDDLSDVHCVTDSTSTCVSPARVLPHCQLSPSLPSDEKGFIAAVVKSAATRVHDKELSSALETIRSYILNNDASIMPLFLELQLKLAAVSCS